MRWGEWGYGGGETDALPPSSFAAPYALPKPSHLRVNGGLVAQEHGAQKLAVQELGAAKHGQLQEGGWAGGELSGTEGSSCAMMRRLPLSEEHSRSPPSRPSASSAPGSTEGTRP